MSLAPTLFLSHGMPTFALAPGQLGPRLQALGSHLTGLTAIMVVSPHWQTGNVRVMSSPAPPTEHDFAGFPRTLFELRYAAPGHPEFAMRAARLLATAGFETALDDSRGLDHGAWVPLRYLKPSANVPVFQVSMPRWLNPAEALRIGRALTPLRAHGVMLIGSGNLTHNLSDLTPPEAGDAAYATAFADWVDDAVIANDTENLLRYRNLAPHAERAHPSDEHFLPLLVAYGARIEGEVAHLIRGGITHGALVMNGYGWGLPAMRAY